MNTRLDAGWLNGGETDEMGTLWLGLEVGGEGTDCGDLAMSGVATGGV